MSEVDPTSIYPFHVLVATSYFQFALLDVIFVQCESSLLQYHSAFTPVVRPSISIHAAALLIFRFVTVPFRIFSETENATLGARSDDADQKLEIVNDVFPMTPVVSFLQYHR